VAQKLVELKILTLFLLVLCVRLDDDDSLHAGGGTCRFDQEGQVVLGCLLVVDRNQNSGSIDSCWLVATRETVCRQDIGIGNQAFCYVARLRLTGFQELRPRREQVFVLTDPGHICPVQRLMLLLLERRSGIEGAAASSEMLARLCDQERTWLKPLIQYYQGREVRIRPEVGTLPVEGGEGRKQSTAGFSCSASSPTPTARLLKAGMFSGA
jgi:hypothetical protein